VVCVCQSEGVEFLKICDEIMYTLRVQELREKVDQHLTLHQSRIPSHLPDNIARLRPSNSLHELRHSAIIIAFRIQVVPILLMNICHTGLVKSVRPGHVECENV
jgi:hypothetical protein